MPLVLSHPDSRIWATLFLVLTAAEGKADANYARMDGAAEAR